MAATKTPARLLQLHVVLLTLFALLLIFLAAALQESWRLQSLVHRRSPAAIEAVESQVMVVQEENRELHQRLEALQAELEQLRQENAAAVRRIRLLREALGEKARELKRPGG